MRILDRCFRLIYEFMAGTAHRTNPKRVMDHPAMKRKDPFLMVKSNEEAMTMMEPKEIRTMGILSDLVVTFIVQLSVSGPQ